MRITRELTIRRDPATVFRWIESPELARQWQPEVLEYEITRAEPGVVGTEFRERIGDETGTMQMLGRVSAYARDALVEFEVEGKGISLTARYALAPAAEGTRLRVDTDYRVGGPLSFVLGPLVRGRLGRQMAAELERLRRLCESEPPPGA